MSDGQGEDTSPSSNTVDRGAVIRKKGDYRTRRNLTPEKKARILEQAASLGYRRGYQITIAKDLGISQAAVSKILKKSRNNKE